MIVFPNAKINLGLDILRRRPDGYHDIATVMYPLPWCDVLEVVPANGEKTTLTVTGNAVDCPPEKNLVMKAYNSLLEEVSGLPAVDIYLRKIIPDGAGLGGGSSDAAFTLVALNELFSLGMTREQLADIAASIGADCPFFIYNRPMLCTGIGTDMTEVEVPALRGMLIGVVKPSVSVPTRDAYAGVTPRVPSGSLAEVMSVFPGGDSAMRVVNAFEESVFASYPEIAMVKRQLAEDKRLPQPVYVAMSGSGASVFALYDMSVVRADKLAETLVTVFPESRTFATVLC